MKKLLVAYLALVPFFAVAQTDFNVAGFSDRYIGVVHVDKGYEDEIVKKGSVTILNASDHKQVIKVEAERFVIGLDVAGLVKANVMELPYGEQSVIIYKDFDFDGINDMAVMDNLTSCYGGPSFQVYLQREKGLVHSPEFTRLAQDYCGMFQVDYETRTIHTMVKGSCCIHVFSDFKVIDGKPHKVKVVERRTDSWDFLIDYKEENIVNGKVYKKSYTLLDMEQVGDNVLFSFSFKNGKTMRLFRSSIGNLFYVFSDSEHVVELFCSKDFAYSKSNNTLTFYAESTEYTVYAEGIVVSTKDGKIDMKADITTVRGAISSIGRSKPGNVVLY